MLIISLIKTLLLLLILLIIIAWVDGLEEMTCEFEKIH